MPIINQISIGTGSGIGTEIKVKAIGDAIYSTKGDKVLLDYDDKYSHDTYNVDNQSSTNVANNNCSVITRDVLFYTSDSTGRAGNFFYNDKAGTYKYNSDDLAYGYGKKLLDEDKRIVGMMQYDNSDTSGRLVKYNENWKSYITLWSGYMSPTMAAASPWTNFGNFFFYQKFVKYYNNYKVVLYVDPETNEVTDISGSFDSVGRLFFMFKSGGKTYAVNTYGSEGRENINAQCHLFEVNVPSGATRISNCSIPTTRSNNGFTIPLDEEANYVVHAGNPLQVWKKISDRQWVILDSNFNNFEGNVIVDTYNYYVYAINTSTREQAYFYVNPETDEVIRLDDIFLPDEFPASSYGISVGINLKDGLISMCSSGLTKPVIKVVSNTNPYQFLAQKYVSGSKFATSTLTGFVKENLGRDKLDNVVLAVDTTLDPNAQPWTDVGKVFGFDIISSHEGEIE